MPLDVGGGRWNVGMTKKITLQTSKLIYKCKELGVMKKSLKVQEESISIL